MPKKQKKFADDGWAIWIDGDDTSTVYINDWLNPKGKSYVDLAIRIRGIGVSTALNVYVPFEVSREEIEDLSKNFHDKAVLKAIFSAVCLVDFKKNEHTSEIAYNGKTIDIVHIDTLDFSVENISNGTLVRLPFDQLHQFLDNDEAYFICRLPHKSLNAIFKPRINVGNILQRFRDLITTPVSVEKYGYSIRINESRLLPEEINRIGAFHRQKLKKALVSISINDSYELNDMGCYRIHRLEEKLYADFIPKKYNTENVITYQWTQNRDNNYQGHFNFYFNISKESISRASMLVYTIILLVLGAAGDGLYDLFLHVVSLFK